MLDIDREKFAKELLDNPYLKECIKELSDRYTKVLTDGDPRVPGFADNNIKLRAVKELLATISKPLKVHKDIRGKSKSVK